jgi:hypothetical protein
MDGRQRDYHSLIARAIAGPHGGTRESRQVLYKHARSTQLNNIIIGKPRSATEIRSERDALEQAIREVEIEAASTETERAEIDAKIISDLAGLMAEQSVRLDCLYDVTILPHPKGTIIAAIERQIVRSKLEDHIDLLRSAATFICNFIDGIGSDPLLLNGFDISQQPRRTTPADMSELNRIFAGSEYQENIARFARFTAIAEKEDKEIEQRIAVALDIRRAVRG